jgi:hypothetical protein
MKQTVWGILAVVLTASTATAQEPASRPTLQQLVERAAPVQAAPQASAAPAEPARVKATVTAGVDFPTLYFFRGIRQEADADLTAQPWADVAIAGSGPVSVNVGTWNSLHSGTNQDAGDGNAWYESDIYGQVTFAAGKFKPALLYTAYTSPADVYRTVSELAGVLTYDDSAMGVPLSPKVIVAFELSDAQADGGASKGVYLELGVKPAFKVAPKLTINIPAKLGLSLKDYYESPLTGDDSAFGYFDIGAQASVPLTAMIEVHGGVDVYAFGSTLKLFNDDKASRAVGTVGLSFTF